MFVKATQSIIVSQLLRGTGESGEGQRVKIYNKQLLLIQARPALKVSPGCPRAQLGHRYVCLTHTRTHTHRAINETAETGR